MSDPKWPHANCEWEAVPPCVYCKEHDERLYQGKLPANNDERRYMVEFFEAAYRMAEAAE